MKNFDSDMQTGLDRFAKLRAPPIETLPPENTHNNPILKNAVEEMAANSATVKNCWLPVLTHTKNNEGKFAICRINQKQITGQ